MSLRRPSFLAPCLSLFATAAAAQAPLLDAQAFERPRTCAVEPLADPSGGQREEALQRDCGLDRLNLRVDTPRVRPQDTGPDQVVVEVDQVVTRQIHDFFVASARVGWSGATQEGFTRMETGQALVAASGRVRLHERWALDMNVGRDLGGLRTRATVAGTWRPAEDHLLFAELAAEGGGIANTVGYRWWLVPERAVVDVTARRSADGLTLEPRLGLQVFGFAR
jgi:hypothetical protein